MELRIVGIAFGALALQLVACGDDGQPSGGAGASAGLGGAGAAGSAGRSGRAGAAGSGSGSGGVAGMGGGEPGGASGEGQGGDDIVSAGSPAGDGASGEGQGGEPGAGGGSLGGSAGTGGGAGVAGAFGSGGEGGEGGEGTPNGAGAAGEGGTGGTAANGAGGASGTTATAGGGGSTGSEEWVCENAADCVVRFGSIPCGSWSCSAGGRCELSSPGCTDADGDGYGVGDDCGCAEIDCDDSDPEVAATARETCGLASGPHGGCFASIRSCMGGKWSECRDVPGEQPAGGGEACNGEDDDCNGEVDEGLGDFSCGLGVCRRTVKACRAGVLRACVPGTPATSTDGCNGQDDDCDGATDEDCGDCVRVAPEGDDAAAAGNGAATPFRNVQPAIDFAAASSSSPRRVCVAAGAACGASATYAGPAGDLTMRDGVSVYGKFESTTWTRCANSTTRLAPTTAAGVLFPASVATHTELDGFAIDRLAASTTAGVTVDGAMGAHLSGLAIESGPASTVSYGVNVIGGGTATIVRSRVDGGLGTQLAVGVRAVSARVFVEDNCTSPEAVLGRCDDGCSSGPAIQGRAATEPYPSYAVWLDDAAGSRIERNALCARATGADSDQGPLPISTAAAIRIEGDGSDILVRGNNLEASNRYELAAAYGIVMDGCEGGAPWIADNHSIQASLSPSNTAFEAVRSAGDCHPVIDSNRDIVAVANTNFDERGAFAVACAEAGGTGSRCVISGNASIRGAGNTNTSRNLDIGGIRCEGGCAKIVRNVVTARSHHPLAAGGCGMSCSIEGRALLLERSGAFVDRNNFMLGCVTHGFTVTSADSWARVQNNFIQGREPSACTDLQPNLYYAGETGLRVENGNLHHELDAHSNHVSTSRLQACVGTTVLGVDLVPLAAPPAGPLGIFRNNRISIATSCVVTAPFRESTANVDPRILEHNALYRPSFAHAFYSGDGAAGDATDFTNIANVNALSDIVSDGNVAGDDFVENDAGTLEDAPLWDYFGTARGERPDIGAVEVSP